jgi:hypothetical protein
LGAILLLAPVAVYFLVLARINMRARPTVLSGPVDAALLLLACSGVFLYLGPGLLTDFHFSQRDVWLVNHYSAVRGMPLVEGRKWWAIWWVGLCLAYALALALGGAIVLWLRRRVTSIYNIELDTLELALKGSFEREKLGWTRQDDGFALAPDHGPPPVAKTSNWASVHWREWDSMRHISLVWTGPMPVKRSIERRLRTVFAGVATRENAVGVWLMAATAVLFVALFVLTVLYQAARLVEGKW